MYELISSIMFLILFGIWKKNDLMNLFLKVVFLLLFVYGFFEALVEYGFIVHIGAMQ